MAPAPDTRSYSSGSSRRILTRNLNSKGQQLSPSASIESSTSCHLGFSRNAITDIVVKEIRSSLSIARSIIEDNPPDDHSSTTKETSIDGHPITSTIRFECGRLKYSHVKEEWSIRHKNDDNMASYTSSSSPLLQHYNSKTIASLWPLFKQCDIQVLKSANNALDDDTNTNTSKNISNNNHNTGITRRRTRSHDLSENEKQQLNRPSTGDERVRIKSTIRQSSRKRKKLSEHDNGIVSTEDNNNDDIDSIGNHNIKLNGVQKATAGAINTSSPTLISLQSQLISPPIELVRCVLQGAEFISMIIYAQWEMERSISSCASENNNKNDVKVRDTDNLLVNTPIASKYEIRCWSRQTTKNCKQVSINLQPMLVAIAEASIHKNSVITSKSEDDFEDNNRNIGNSVLQVILRKLTDECIRFAHAYTLDLITPWKSSWQIRTVFPSENMVDNEKQSSSTTDNTIVVENIKRSKRKIDRRRSRKGERVGGNENSINDKQSNASISFDTISVIQEFVRACLAQPSQDGRARQDFMSNHDRINTLTNISLVNVSDRSNGHNNKNKKKIPPSSPKRTKKVFRGSKDFANEPADSLAGIVTTTKYSARDHLSLSTKNKDPSLKQRHNRTKLNRHFSPPSSPSISENAATVRSQRGSRPHQTIHTNSGGKRKSSAYLSLDMARNPLQRKEEKSLKRAHEEDDLDDDTYDYSNCKNKYEVGIDVENMPSNSLYGIFDQNNHQKVSDIPSETFPVNSGVDTGVDTSNHVSSPKKQETTGCTVRRSPRRKVRWDGIMKSPLIGADSCYQHKEQQQQQNEADSLSQISNNQGCISSPNKSLDKLSIDCKLHTDEHTIVNMNKYSIHNKIDHSLISNTPFDHECIKSRARQVSKFRPMYKMQNNENPEILVEHIETKNYSEDVEGPGLFQEGSIEVKEETLGDYNTDVVEGVKHKPVEEIQRHEKGRRESVDMKYEAIDESSTMKINGEVYKTPPLNTETNKHTKVTDHLLRTSSKEDQNLLNRNSTNGNETDNNLLGPIESYVKIGHTKRDLRTGLWTKKENMAFLLGIRIHGQGQWKKIAEDYIPTRNSRQVKTRAQTTKKAHGSNYGNFSELDEYLKKHPNFWMNWADINAQEDLSVRRGNAIDLEDHVNSQGILFNTTCIDDPTGLEDDFSTNWVKLSHIGHVSDYHGYKRKYDHYFPLQHGSIDNIRGQIERTLIVNKVVNGEESDEEVIQEDMEYYKVVQLYGILAKQERSRRKKSKIDSPQGLKEDGQDKIPVMFQSPKNDLTGEKWKPPSIFDVDESNLHPPINFKFFDEEDDVLVNATEDKTNNGKRKSRSAQIASQKKTSILVLSEMLHSLDFIDEYNSKLTKEEDESNEEEKEGKEENEMEEMANYKRNNDCDSERKCERETSVKKSSRTARGVGCGVRRSTKAKKSPIKFKPVYVHLTETTLLADYNELQNKNPYFYPLKEKSGIESTKEKIECILGKSNVIKDFSKNEETVAEEKSLGRIIRGYSRKADQEKIEKRNFEEKQNIQQQEFEYYRKRKRNKKSPHEIEWKEIQSRPFRYELIEKDIEDCKFEPNCPICAPILHDESSTDSKIIFFPGFERIDDIPVDGEGTIDISHSLDEQELLSTLKLSELYHSVGFIQRYNNGMIVSSQKRR